jgi:hypothetical protein
MEGSNNTLMEVLSWNLHGETEENQGNLCLVGVPAQIKTEAPSNTRPHSVSLYRITEKGTVPQADRSRVRDPMR